MTLEKGSLLGPYEIGEVVGEGGMGQVYRARDTRLERTVAIKVLPAHLADRPELRQRLEREAKAVSSLSHPHICSLFDVGHEQGVQYLVMEYIEGETLAERLMRGPLPTSDLLRYGIQIADALESAHHQGITHRDLKPGNIMLTPSGTKLLDFGLAKADDSVRGDNAELTMSPTVSSPLTAAGAIVGTFQYMAPEQLEGVSADARTDIFALGAVLYEMATGQRAFAGGSQASLIADIMHEMPRPASNIEPMTPPALDRVIQSCLAKDPDDRWQAAHDVKLQLQWIAEGGSMVGLPAPVAAKRRNRERLGWIVAATAAIAAVLFAVGFVLRAPDTPQQVRFQIPPPHELAFVGSPRISPNGKFVAFRGSNEEGTAQIWVHSLDTLNPRPTSGTEGVKADSRPFWSPDSRHIAFFTDDNKLKRVPFEGGVVQTICDANGADGSWSVKGEIVFDVGSGEAIDRVPASGGIARPIAALNEEAGETSVAWPEFLPDGEHYLYVLEDKDNPMKVMLRASDGGEATEICETDSRVQYAEPGFLLYVKNQTLIALPFDARSQKAVGEPIPIADDVQAASYGLADFSASTNGTLVYRGGTSDVSARRLVWRDRTGKELGAVGEPGILMNHWLSPDGTHVATGILGPNQEATDLWIFDLERGVTSRFTFDPASDSTPVWSPDGSRIAFSSNRDGGSPNLYVKDASGAGEAEELLMVDEAIYPGDWTKDGRYLSYMFRVNADNWDVWALPMDSGGDPFPVANSDVVETRPSFSPDGQWIAYQVLAAGQSHVYVKRFPEGGGKWQISTTEGGEPYWTKNGTEIIFRDPSWNFFAVPVELGETVRAGSPELLFQGSSIDQVLRDYYQVTPDGERFLLLEQETIGSRQPTTVVLNWTTALEP